MQEVQTSSLNKYFAKIYLLMALGLAMSATMSFGLLMANPFQAALVSFVNHFPLGFTGLWLVELLLVIVLGMKGQKNPTLALTGFIAFSLINGLVIAVTLYAYELGSVVQAFVGASAMFVGLGIFGAVTKKDLTGLGSAARALLIGLIIMIPLNLFIFRSSGMEMLISCLALVVFSALTAYDHQKIKAYYQRYGNQNGIAIFMALQLYLDFINLFLSLLRLTGSRRS